jgi:hypothetical protein
MIRMSWLALAHPQFQNAIRSIWECPMLDARTSYSAHRIQQGIQKTEKDIRNLRIKLCEKWGKKDENGNVVNDEQGFILFERKEDNEAFEKEFRDEFQARELVLKVSKLDFEKLAQVRGITPSMWEFLAPIMDNLPKDEDEEAQEQLEPKED